MTPQKIYELKGQDWMKGISIQAGIPIGGIFAAAPGFNPFETMGYMQSSISPTQVNGTTITTQVNHLASATDASDSTGYTFALGNRSATGEKCLYVIKNSDGSVIDYSAFIDQDAVTGAVVHNGGAWYKNRFIYASSTSNSIRSNYPQPEVAGDKELLTTANVDATYAKVAFGIGSDGALYYTATSFFYPSIGKIVQRDAASGSDGTNINNAFVFTDKSLMPRDICNDGIYTIFIADNNLARNRTATQSCRIFFWDSQNNLTNASIIYDIPDSYLISCRYVDGKVLVLGASGLWVCNSASAPKLVFPLASTKLPTDASQVTVQGNIMYWAGTALGAGIYAYGSNIGKAILFNPFNNGGGDNLHTALVSSGSYFVTATNAGTNVPKVFLHNFGTTRSGGNAYTTVTVLPQTYSLSSIKVTLKAPLTTGDSITLSLYNGNGQVIMDTSTKSFAQDGAKQTFIFQPKSLAGSFNKFEDFWVAISAIDGAIIQRVAVYGIPVEEPSQII